MKPVVENVSLMRNKKFSRNLFFLLLIPYLFFFELKAQNEIPIGDWRMHISYRQTFDLAIGGPNIYCSSANGVFIYSKDDNSIGTLSKLNGLSDNSISAIGYSEQKNILLVGYKNGNLDLLINNELINYSVLKESNYNEKSINHFLFSQDIVYISTDVGVLVFDLDILETRVSYLNLGAAGEILRINYSELFNDSLFLASENGVLAGSLHPDINLQDFNNWYRFEISQGIPAIETNSLAFFDNKLYAAISMSGIYEYSNNNWLILDSLQNSILNNIWGNDVGLTVSTESDIWTLENGTLTKTVGEEVSFPQKALLEPNGELWIADFDLGLRTNMNGSFETILPSGPFSDNFFNLFYHEDRIIGLGGGYDESRNPLGRLTGFYDFENGFWSNYSPLLYDLPADLVDIAFDDIEGKYLITSFGGGYLQWDGESSINTFDQASSNYPFNSDSLSAALTSDVLWVTTYNSQPSIYYRDNNGIWTALEISQPGSDQILEIVSDFDGNTWFRVDPNKTGGIIVYNPVENKSRWLGEGSGNGGLPNKSVNDMEVDLEGNIWIATNEGVAYYPRGSFSLDLPLDAIRPILDGRFLLNNEKVTCIKRDGGNRKWTGTENGLWHFSEFGDELLANFTIENSPLLSNRIIDLEINANSGEVFIATDLGALSYRSDATEGAETHASEIKVFPNPITSDFNGIVGISGLANNSEVRITDVSGNLVWQMQANGSTASWNLSTIYGGRPSSGIYLIFSSTSDGSDTFVGKMAIID
jgi:ligand-binding sensor domain-containing protein